MISINKEVINEMNRQIFRMLGITEEEYKEWCESQSLSAYKVSTKQEFFSKIQSGQIVRDSKTGKLIEKRKKNDEM